MATILDRALGGAKKIDNFRVVPPLDGGWSLTPMDNLLRGISHHKEPVSLELFARDGVVCYMVRAYHGEAMGGILHSYFPQSRVERRVDDGVAEPDAGDWLHLDEDEHALALPLYLKEDNYLPLRIFSDRDIEQSKIDPLAGVIGMLASATHSGGESPGDRLGLRLVIHPARENWNGKWRDKIQKRRDGDDKNDFGRQLSPQQRESPRASLYVLVGGTVAWALGNLWLWQSYTPAYLVPFNLAMTGVGAGGWALLRKAEKQSAREYIDEELVEQKLKSPAFGAELQIVRVYRNPADRGTAEEQVMNMVDCLRSHDDPVGNTLRSGKLRFYRGEDFYQGERKHIFLGGSQFLGWLEPKAAEHSVMSSREVAALWHLPLGTEEMASMERSAGGVLRPFLSDLGRGGEDAGPVVGVAESGQEIRLPESALRKHSLILGKSGVGKSTMVKHIIAHKLKRKAAGKDNSAVVVIDPHADLVRDVLKMVPPEIAHKVRLLDLGRMDRVPGINLVDPRLFPERDRCVDTIINTVRYLWEHWGGRLEDLLKRSLSMIYEFNSHEDTRPEDMLTMLDIIQLLDGAKRVGSGRDVRMEASDFQRYVLKRVKDPSLLEWFNSYLGWGAETRSEAVGPVLNRVGAYAQNDRAAVIMGQRDTTIMLSDVLTEGLVLLVSTAQGTIGVQPAALMGGTIVSLVEAALRDQERLDPSLRAKCLMVADEFQTITGANWEGMLAEIRKYGCSLMLATQSLERLDTSERKLKAGILGNVGVMVGYNMSADDAHILAAEMDDERVQPRTFVNLDPHHCCVRITSDTKCYPAFSMKTLPPPDLVEGSLASEEAVLAASVDYTVDCAEVRQRLHLEKWQRMDLDRLGTFGSAAAAAGAAGVGAAGSSAGVAGGSGGNGRAVGAGAAVPAGSGSAAAAGGGGAPGGGGGVGGGPSGRSATVVDADKAAGGGEGMSSGLERMMARFGSGKGGAGNGSDAGAASAGVPAGAGASGRVVPEAGKGPADGAEAVTDFVKAEMAAAAAAASSDNPVEPGESDPYLQAVAANRAAREARIERGPLRGMKAEELARSSVSEAALKELASVPSSDLALRHILARRLGDQANSERQRVRQEESGLIRKQVESELAAEKEAVAAERELLAAEKESVDRLRQSMAAEAAVAAGAAAVKEELGVELEGVGTSRDVSQLQPAARQRPTVRRPSR